VKKFSGAFAPWRDPIQIYEYVVTATRDGTMTMWDAELRCGAELRRPISGIIEFAPELEEPLRARVEELVRDSIERHIGVD
jgi:hypothetical protein